MKKNIFFLVIVGLLMSNPVSAMQGGAGGSGDDWWYRYENGRYHCAVCHDQSRPNIHSLKSHFEFYHGPVNCSPQNGDLFEDIPEMDLGDIFEEGLPELSGKDSVGQSPFKKRKTDSSVTRDELAIFYNVIPPEIKCEVFNFLKSDELLGSMRVVNKEMKNLVDDYLEKTTGERILCVNIDEQLLEDKNFDRLIERLKEISKKVTIDVRARGTEIRDMHLIMLSCVAALKSLDVKYCPFVSLGALFCLKEINKDLMIMIKSEYGDLGGSYRIGPANVIRFDRVQRREAVSWPILSQLFVRDADVPGNPIRDIQKLHFAPHHPSRDFTRYIDFIVSILPGLNQGPTAECGLYALFHAAALRQDDNEFRVNYRRLAQLRATIVGGGQATENLQSAEMEAIVRNNNFFQALRNNDGSLQDNVSIIDSLPHLERDFCEARRNDYFILSNKMDKLQDDIDRVGRMGQPREMECTEVYELGYTPHVIENIRRFRRTGATQTIILHTGRYHWITMRLRRDNGQDHIEVVDSCYAEGRSEESLQELAQRVYCIFKTDLLPPEQN